MMAAGGYGCHKTAAQNPHSMPGKHMRRHGWDAIYLYLPSAPSPVCVCWVPIPLRQMGGCHSATVPGNGNCIHCRNGLVVLQEWVVINHADDSSPVSGCLLVRRSAFYFHCVKTPGIGSYYACKWYDRKMFSRKTGRRRQRKETNLQKS